MDEPNKTFDPMTAPLSDVLDWLAERDGWEVRRDHQVVAVWYTHPLFGPFLDSSDNPITLDRIAGMLKEGWRWNCIRKLDAAWFAEAEQEDPYTIVDCHAHSELEARARVVAAVLGREKA